MARKKKSREEILSEGDTVYIEVMNQRAISLERRRGYVTGADPTNSLAMVVFNATGGEAIVISTDYLVLEQKGEKNDGG